MLLSRGGSRASKVRSTRLEYPIRVQRIRSNNFNSSAQSKLTRSLFKLSCLIIKIYSSSALFGHIRRCTIRRTNLSHSRMQLRRPSHRQLGPPSDHLTPQQVLHTTSNIFLRWEIPTLRELGDLFRASDTNSPSHLRWLCRVYSPTATRCSTRGVRPQWERQHHQR